MKNVSAYCRGFYKSLEEKDNGNESYYEAIGLRCQNFCSIKVNRIKVYLLIFTTTKITFNKALVIYNTEWAVLCFEFEQIVLCVSRKLTCHLPMPTI